MTDVAIQPNTESPGVFSRDHFVGNEIASAISTEMQALRETCEFKPAGIGSGVSHRQDSTSRGGSIAWLDKKQLMQTTKG